MASWALLAIVGLGTLALAGLLLTFVGLRGRRVGDHPHCRRCGFDVWASGETCPECGANLTQPKATRIGLRQRRPGLATVGLLLLLPGLLVAGVLGYGMARDLDWQSYKPARLLVWELDTSDTAVRDAAVAELTKRMKLDELSASDAAATVDWALARQADRSGPWKTEWGALVEMARNNGKATDQQWKQFATNGIVPVLEARPDIRAGDPLPTRITWDRRLGPTRQWLVYPLVKRMAAAGVEWEVEEEHGGLELGGRGGMAWRFGSPDFDEAFTADLPLGPGETELTLELLIAESPRRSMMRPPSEPMETPLATKTHELSASLNVRDSSEPSGWLAADDAERAKALEGVEVTALIRKSEKRLENKWERETPWELALVTTNRDARVGERVVVLVGGERFETTGGGMIWANHSTAAYEQGNILGFPELPRDADGEWPDTATVLILPDEEAAKNDVDPTPYWGEILIFRDVPLDASGTKSPQSAERLSPDASVPLAPDGGLPRSLEPLDSSTTKPRLSPLQRAGATRPATTRPTTRSAPDYPPAEAGSASF